jgi:GGDEF domain-containing protein
MLARVTEKGPKILHVCSRDPLRPLRDQVLRVSGYRVESVARFDDALPKFEEEEFDLVLIDIEAEGQISLAEELCGHVKKMRDGQNVAFACNWRVSIDSTCPDDIIRTEFNPEAFVAGVRSMFPPSSGSNAE